MFGHLRHIVPFDHRSFTGCFLGGHPFNSGWTRQRSQIVPDGCKQYNYRVNRHSNSRRVDFVQQQYVTAAGVPGLFLPIERGTAIAEPGEIEGDLGVVWGGVDSAWGVTKLGAPCLCF